GEYADHVSNCECAETGRERRLLRPQNRFFTLFAARLTRRKIRSGYQGSFPDPYLVDLTAASSGERLHFIRYPPRDILCTRCNISKRWNVVQVVVIYFLKKRVQRGAGFLKIDQDPVVI